MFNRVLLVHDNSKGKLASFDVLIKKGIKTGKPLKEFLGYFKKISYNSQCLYVNLFKKKFKNYEYICSEDFCHLPRYSFTKFGGVDEEVRKLIEKYRFKPIYITNDGDMFLLENYNLDVVIDINEHNGEIPTLKKLS